MGFDMTTQTIEVDVPNGYEISKIEYFSDSQYIKVRIKEKIQPRRIVLESTTESRKAKFGDWIYNNGAIEQWRSEKESQSTYQIWREVKETAIPLTNEDANVKMGVSQGDGDDQKLELSVKELRNVRSLIKDFENLGWFINPERALLLQKITEFIKDK